MPRRQQTRGLRRIIFERVCGRSHGSELSRLEAGEVVGISERRFRRWRDRYEVGGRKDITIALSRVSAQRRGLDEVAAMVRLVAVVRYQAVACHAPGSSARSRNMSMISSAATTGCA